MVQTSAQPGLDPKERRLNQKNAGERGTVPIRLNHQLREQIFHNSMTFAITYFQDELAELPHLEGPLHWHPDFELASVENSTLEYQVGQQRIVLEPGDSIFVNGNVLHGVKQLEGNQPEPMPNIVFSGSVVAPESSIIFQKYIKPIALCDQLPFVVFRHNDRSQDEVNEWLKTIYSRLRRQDDCFELAVQRNLSRVFEYLFRNFERLPKTEVSRIQITAQVRIQKMLSYIYENYSNTVTLEDIARAANISRSEAGRSFHAYMGCSPVDALIQYRLQIAHALLNDKSLTLEEISCACGFHSVRYFNRQFKKKYGCTPHELRRLGK